MIDGFVERKIFTENEANSINIYKLLSYTKSELFNELKHAKKVYKEQPFYINVKSNEIYNDESDEDILVQGIIDLYYIDQNDEVILVDYKTDYVEKENEIELVKKYSKQLEIYKRALEQGLNKKVKKSMIYSVYLEKLIKL
jgi:ATP-dependent helicase/nuclease subunit A